MKKILLFAMAIGIGCAAFAQDLWPPLTQYTKPWTRWWWMGSAVDEKNISNLLRIYQKAGLGGVEVVPIYGAMGYEKNYIPYLSPQWIKMLDHTTQQSAALNMGVYISVGSGWPIGGPQVTAADAATKLVIQKYQIKRGGSLKDKLIINDEQQRDVARLSALMAYGNDETLLEITDKVGADGVLNWNSAAGDWQLYAAFIGKTKQAVKRAAPGGEGYTLDHFSKISLNNYFKKWDTAFGNSAHGVRAFYNDSYEVYNADFTPAFFDEFRKRRGYDLKIYLRELASDVSA
jgi:hypothetical protein